MKNEIRWASAAARQIAKLRKKNLTEGRKVYSAIQKLSAMPNCRNVKRLTDSPLYRLRIGRYRVIFDWESGVQIVTIEEIKKRDKDTY